MFKFCPSCGKKVTDQSKDGFKCNFCHKSTFYNSKPTATVTPVYQQKEILIGVRKDDPYKGSFELLGGFLRNGEHPRDGAIREFQEETGIMIDKKDLALFDVLVDEYPYEGNTYFTLNFFYIVKFDKKVMPKPSEEVTEFLWMSLDKRLNMAFKYENIMVSKLAETTRGEGSL